MVTPTYDLVMNTLWVMAMVTLVAMLALVLTISITNLRGWLLRKFGEDDQ